MVAMVQEQDRLSSRVRALTEVLSMMTLADWQHLDSTTVTNLLGELAKASTQMRAHQIAGARVLEAANVARKHGATSTGDLLGRHLGNDLSAGNRLVRAAQDIQPESRTEAAFGSGDLTERQARIISNGVKQLSGTVTASQRDRAEERLIRDAQVMRPTDLQRRADRISDVFAPKAEVDRTENDLLVAREQAARKNTRLELFDNRDGTHSGRFTIPDLAASQLKAALQALSAPRRDHLRDEAPTDFPHRLGTAFTELIGFLPTGELPTHGGVAATVTVNIDLDALTNELSVIPGTLTDGCRLSAGEVRRLACDAGLLPQVLGGASVPLDLGQERRFFSRHQRIALAYRDRGCSFPGCDRPPGWCEAHHARDRWSDGGTTDLADGALLCAHHHRTVHTEHWEYRINQRDGTPEYRSAGSDIWQRNHRWRA